MIRNPRLVDGPSMAVAIKLMCVFLLALTGGSSC